MSCSNLGRTEILCKGAAEVLTRAYSRTGVAMGSLRDQPCHLHLHNKLARPYAATCLPYAEGPFGHPPSFAMQRGFEPRSNVGVGVFCLLCFLRAAFSGCV